MFHWKYLLLILPCIFLLGCHSQIENEASHRESEPGARGDVDASTKEPASARAARYDELEMLLRAGQFRDAIALNDLLIDEYGYDAFLLAHKSMVYSGMLNITGDDDNKIETYLKEAIYYAGKALAMDSLSKWGNLAMALAYARQAHLSNFTSKASYSKLANEHCRKVLAIDPHEPASNFILGRFYFEVADLGGAASLMARPILGKEEIEKASFDLALSYLKKSSQKQPDRFIYVYFTGLAYSKADNDKEALRYFERAKKLAPKSKDEQELYLGLDKLISKIS